MIKLRLDVDYPYPSRAKSFLYIAFGIKRRKSKDYLKNARIIAKMINDSSKEVMAYWFFTPYTIPDGKLLALLGSERHEIGLHVATDPCKELQTLENQTQRKINYYTMHGTPRAFAQLLWRRKLGQRQVNVPTDFPAKSFHDFPTFSLDTERFKVGFEAAKKSADEWMRSYAVLSIHPDWLFKSNKRSGRGPYYDVFKYVLDVDHDLEALQVKDRFSVKVARDTNEYETKVSFSDGFLEKLRDRGFDVFTFIERKWCCPIQNSSSAWSRKEDNVALLEIKDYDSWWNSVGKKTRNMARKAEKSGIKVAVAEPSDKLAEGISNIYNETPIRQERAFPNYGEPLDIVTYNMYRVAPNSTFIGATLQDELVGFIQIKHGDNIAVISQILSMQKHWDKAVNNVLLAKAVEVCAANGTRWLMYGRIGNHPSLDRFKESNGFVKYSTSRYYIPLTQKGKIAIRLGLHRDLKDTLPDSLKNKLIPVLTWASRNRIRIRDH